MTLNSLPNNLDDAVLSALRGDTTIRSLASSFIDDTGTETYGVHDQVVPDGAGVPHLVVLPVSDVPEYMLGKTSTIQTLSYLVRAVGDDRASAGALLAAADAVLNFAALVVTGYSTISMVREGSGQRYADNDGFYNSTYYYRLIVQK